MARKGKKTSGSGVLQSIRQIFGLNIGTVLFGILLVYMAFSLILYLTASKVESYQVIAGPLSRNENYTGLAICESSVYTADSSGYLAYYAREGTKINAGGAVYGISNSQSTQTSTDLSSDDLANIRSSMQSFSKSFNTSSFNSTYTFKYSLEGSILQYAGVTKTTDDEGNETVSYGGRDISFADQDGIVLYSVDGYEDITVDNVTAEDFDQNSYHKTDLKTTESVEAGDTIYSLLTDERWSLLIPLSSKQAENLADRTVVRVKFDKDGKTQSGDFSIIEIDGESYGQIDFNKGLIRYASDRFLDIELVTNTVSGLKIPLSSIVDKEFYTIPKKYATTNDDSSETGFMVENGSTDGSMTFVNATIYASISTDSENADEDNTYYYVDKKAFSEGDVIVSQKDQSKYTVHEVNTLQGVYCINQGYAVFCRVEVLDQNEEYAIVSDDTTYGLAKYDHIVQNASKVDEDEILY